MANELRENKISHRYVNVGPDRVAPNLSYANDCWKLEY